MSKLSPGFQITPKVMDASEYVQRKEKQREYRQRIHPDVKNTYKDVMGGAVKQKEVDERFYKKNMDYSETSR